ncbi:MAG: succinate dehydrogenase, cytochrome b556 subunit [Proteobacteria bacterium]|nr:succinate dehydrogenase, cytochrome b556 subunit [Pseudomonadota bacterium]
MADTQKRPLSPHLQIYRLPLPALLSITHRMTGMALSVGLFVLAAWLYAAAFSPKCFAKFHELFNTGLGRFALFGWMLAFFYHFCAGIRHLVWDTGTGLSKSAYRISNWIVIFSALLLTAGAWLYARGGLQ